MSDVPSSAAIACIGAWTLLALRRRAGPAAWLGVGGLVGLATAIRQTNLLVGLPIAGLLVLDATSGRERAWWLGSFALGTVAGLLPMFAYNLTLFGSPFRDGLSLWVPGAHFGWNLPRFRPAGGSDPNGIFYARLLAGGGSLYSVPIAALLVMGVVEGLRAGGSARRLVLLTLGVVAVWLGAHLGFFTQWDRYFVTPMPLLAATAAFPLRGRSAGWSGLAAVALLVLGAAQMASPRLYDLPDRPLGEVAALQRLAAHVETNAAVFARANPILFERTLRQNADRVLVSLGLDDVRFAIAIGQVAPRNPEHEEPAWMREVVSQPLDDSRVERLVHDIRAQGRPVYLSTMVAFQVPYLARLVTLFTQLGAERVPIGDRDVVLRLPPGPEGARDPDPPGGGT